MATDAKEQARQQGIKSLEKLSTKKPGTFQKVVDRLFGNADSKKTSADR